MPARARPLGRTQRLVLQLLALTGPASAREVEYHSGWHLSESAARSALSRLERGRPPLVAADSFEPTSSRWRYRLTDAGRKEADSDAS